MKKAMWILSVVPVAFTAVVLQFLPDKVPMHYDLAGNIDRWGSKYEELIFPVLIILMALFWSVMISYYRKKAGTTSDEKERAGALSNAKVLCITGNAVAACFMVLQGYNLYRAYAGSKAGPQAEAVDICRLICIVLGLLFIVLGNFMPKTRINSLVGVRLKWSMYNDNTWRKSNRFGAIALIAAGVLAIVTAVFVKSAAGCIAAVLGCICLAAAATAVYAYKVYKEELSSGKEERANYDY